VRHRETELDFRFRSNWTELGVTPYLSESGPSVSEVFASRDHQRETALRSEMLVKPARQNGDKNDQEKTLCSKIMSVKITCFS